MDRRGQVITDLVTGSTILASPSIPSWNQIAGLQVDAAAARFHWLRRMIA